MTTEPEKPLCFVPDTNVWRKRTYLGLQTPVAAALLFTLRRHNGWLGIPEIIESEVEKHLAELTHSEVQAFRNSVSVLGDLGLLNADEPPFDDESLTTLFAPDALEGVGERAINSLEPLIVRVPFRHEHARNAVERINAETPPNKHTSEFKDSAVWEALLELAEEYRVVFVTADKGFFKGRSPSDGLAENLRQEVSDKDLKLDVLYITELGSFIEGLQDDAPPINKTRVLALVGGEIDQQIGEKASERGYDLGQKHVQSLGTFVTEEPGILAVSFAFRYPLTGISEKTEGATGVVATSGSCRFNVETGEVTDVEYGWQFAQLGEPKSENVELWAPFRHKSLWSSTGTIMPFDFDA